MLCPPHFLSLYAPPRSLRGPPAHCAMLPLAPALPLVHFRTLAAVFRPLRHQAPEVTRPHAVRSVFAALPLASSLVRSALPWALHLQAYAMCPLAMRAPPPPSHFTAFLPPTVEGESMIPIRASRLACAPSVVFHSLSPLLSVFYLSQIASVSRAFLSLRLPSLTRVSSFVLGCL